MGPFEHNPDVNPHWIPKVARRVYRCAECGQEKEIVTNHTGVVPMVRCDGICRDVINAHTELEQAIPRHTRHVYVEEC